jgi:thiol-disulfide isomerase/thioredoxin
MKAGKLTAALLLGAILLLSGCDTDTLTNLTDKIDNPTEKPENPAPAPSPENPAPNPETPQEPETPPPPPQEEPEAPQEPEQNYELDTTISTIDGEQISIKGIGNRINVEGYENKIVIFEVFAWWCPDCKAVIPVLNTIQSHYNGDVTIIALENEGISNDEVQSYVDTNGVNYKAAARENTGSLIPYVKGKGAWRGEVPYLIIIDREGVIRTSLSGTGEITEQRLDTEIMSML